MKDYFIAVIQFAGVGSQPFPTDSFGCFSVISAQVESSHTYRSLSDLVN